MGRSKSIPLCALLSCGTFPLLTKVSLSQLIHFLPLPFLFQVGVREGAAVWCSGAYRANPQHREIFCTDCLVISYFGINLDNIHTSYLFGTNSDY